jgi:DNA-binding SARP family transcriptional activator
MPVRLLLFGHPRVEGVEADIPTTKPAYMLLYLACQDDWVSRETLAELLSPEADDAAARRNLRLQLTRAKKYPWSVGLIVQDKRVRWPVASDLADYKRALGRGDWARALSCYRRPLLDNLPSIGLIGFDSWLEETRSALHASWREAARQAALKQHTQHHYAEAARLLEALWRDDPLDERVLQDYLTSRYLAGQQREALLAYEQFAAQLKQALQLTPSTKTRELIATIQRAEPIAMRPLNTAAVPIAVLRPPQLIGRDDAARTLQQSATALTLVTGEAGIGKTRLLQDCLPDALWLKCQEGLANVPYFPVTQAIRQLDQLERYLESLGAYRSDLARLLPELADGTDAPPAEAAEAKARLLEALARLLEEVATPIVFDDLQWADAATLELVICLAARRRARLYGSYRSNESSPELERTLLSLANNLATIPLSPLSPHEVQQLIAELTHSDEGPPRFSHWLFERSAGNPFFALETLRTLFETGRLRASADAWHSDIDALTRDYRELEVPKRVSEVITRRVRGLSAAARTLLEVASVVGRDFSATLLARVSGLALWQVSEALAELTQRGFIEGAHFSHDLLRQALYTALPESQRQLYHAAVAEALPHDDIPLIVAEHWFQAGELAKAADMWFSAASTFFDERPGFEVESMAIYQRILTLGIKTPAVYRAMALIAQRYFGEGRYAEIAALTAQILNESDDDIARAHALLVQMNLRVIQGELQAAAALLAQATRHAQSSQESALLSDVALAEVALALFKGDFERVLALIAPMVAEARRHPPSFGLLNRLGYLAAAYAELGRYDEALPIYFEQLDIARQLGHTRHQVNAYADIISVYQDAGQYARIIPLALAALKLPEKDNSKLIRYILADAYLKTGDLGQAKAYAEPLLTAEISLNLHAHLYALLAELYRATGERAQSHQMIADGLALTTITERLSARAVVIIAALRFGSAAQRAEALARQQTLERARLPAYLKRELAALDLSVAPPLQR